MVNDACIARDYSDFQLNFTTVSPLPGPGTVLYVWRTTQADYFVRDATTLTIDQNGHFSINIQTDSIVTISTEARATHGSFPDPPPTAAAWPLPYADNFDTYADDAMAKYFSDQVCQLESFILIIIGTIFFLGHIGNNIFLYSSQLFKDEMPDFIHLLHVYFIH